MTSVAHPELEGLGTYEYGWADSDDAGATARRGLNEEVVRDISDKKSEPEWMTKLRLKSLRLFDKKPMPDWGADLSKIDFDNIKYFVRSTEKQATSWEDLPEDIKNTYDKLGIPEAEKQRLAVKLRARPVRPRVVRPDRIPARPVQRINGAAARSDDHRVAGDRRPRCRAAHRAAGGVSPMGLPSLTPPRRWRCTLRLPAPERGGACCSLQRTTSFSLSRSARAWRACVLAAVYQTLTAALRRVPAGLGQSRPVHSRSRP